MAESGVTHLEVDVTHFVEHGHICELCENMASVGYCSGCKCCICQLCFNNHIKIKRNLHHVLQIATESKKDGRTIHFNTCTEHTQHEVRLYCTEHKCFGCPECMAFHHNSCKTKYITEASKEFQDSGELARFLQDIRDLENVHKHCVESISSQSELSDNIDKTTTHSVQQFVNDVVSYVTDEKKLIINNAGSKKSINNDKIEKLSNDLNMIGSDISSICANVKEKSMIHEIFILAVQAKPKLSQIRDRLTAIDCQEVIDKYTFYPSKLLQRQLSEKCPLGKLSDNAQSEQDDVDDYECKYKAGCAVNQQLQQQLSSQERIMFAQKQDNQRLQQKLSTQEKLNKILQQQLSSQEIDITRCHQQLSTKEQDNARLQQRLSIQEQDNAKFQQQLSTQEQDNAKLQQKLFTLEKLNKRLQQQLSSQEIDITRCHQQLSTKEQDNARLQQQLSIQEQDNAKVQQQLSTQEQDNAKLQQQLSTQEQDNQRKTLHILKLERDINERIKKYGFISACGHVCDADQMNENRTIKCPTCDIIFGDQPDGTLRIGKEALHTELKFKFDKGTQSKLNLNPGKPYAANELTGYVYFDENLQHMLKLAYDRKILFTINEMGKVVSNGIDIFTRKEPSQ